jgi:hypothetical protein
MKGVMESRMIEQVHWMDDCHRIVARALQTFQPTKSATRSACLSALALAAVLVVDGFVEEPFCDLHFLQLRARRYLETPRDERKRRTKERHEMRK